MGIIVAGVDCENCIYSTIDDTNKARIRVYCDARDRQYWWGQNVPCEDKKKDDRAKEV